MTSNQLKTVIISVLLLAGSSGFSGEFSPRRIWVNTQEFRQFRRIYIQMSGSDQKQNVITPAVQFDRRGQFSITVQFDDSVKYLGSKIIKDTGSHPIEINIALQDSTNFLLSGITNSFYKLYGYYSFASNRYIFDIFWKQPVETVFQEKSLSGDNPGFGQLKVVDVTSAQNRNPSQIGIKHFLAGNSRIWVAVLLAFGFFCIILIINLLIIMRRMKYSSEIPKKNPGEIKREAIKKTEDVDSKKDEIWELADKKGLSYDEAAIVVNMSKEEDNGKLNP